MNTVADLLKRRRVQRGMTQAQLAERLGVSQQVVSRIEKGDGSLEHVVRVCRALGVELTLRIGDETLTLVHAIDPEERREIEANIDWFSRLPYADRLRTMRRHVLAAQRLREAGRRSVEAAGEMPSTLWSAESAETLHAERDVSARHERPDGA